AYAFAARPVPGLVGWSEDFPAAMRLAGASHRNVLVVFQLPGCSPCRRMERSVLPDPKVTRALASLVPVHLDLSQTPQLSERYQVWGTPTYLLLDPQGRLLARDSGYRSVDEFVSFLSRASQ
ncbi:MAG: thioredoxin family protein, partial [Planctomycetes bacterium]|nr:thioredoxin family protein [Planctomycetota bacterium]